MLQVPADKATRDARFAEDLDADSLDLVELVMALEESFDVTVEESELEGIETIGQAFDLIVAKLNAARCRPRRPGRRSPGGDHRHRGALVLRGGHRRPLGRVERPGARGPAGGARLRPRALVRCQGRPPDRPVRAFSVAAAEMALATPASSTPNRRVRVSGHRRRRFETLQNQVLLTGRRAPAGSRPAWCR